MPRSPFATAAIFILGCAVGGAAGQLLVRPAYAQVAGTPRWEYQCVANATAQQLDDAGAKGWELVATPTLMSGGSHVHDDVGYCFKRPAP